MVLKLYGYPQSANLKIIVIVLREKNVPFEFVSVDRAKGKHKSPQHLEKQPFGLVPYMDDDGFILYETRAIARATLFSNKLRPSKQPSAVGYLSEKFKPLFGQQTDEMAIEKHRATLSDKLDVYEKILSMQNYMAGDELTLADLFHLPFAAMLVDHGAGDIIEKRQNVKSLPCFLAGRQG